MRSYDQTSCFSLRSVFVTGAKWRSVLRKSMDISTLIMLSAALVLLVGVYHKAPELAGEGMKAGLALLLEVTPRMIAAFLIAGLVQAIIPDEVIAHWMGTESGSRGIVIGTILGTFTPGGPMMQFPVVASLYKLGIGIGPLVSYLTAWSLIGFQRIIMWEIPFLGLRVVLIRVAVSCLLPLGCGWLSEYLWQKFSE